MNGRSSAIIWSALAAILTVTPLPPSEARSQEQPKAISPLTIGSKVRLQAPTVISGRIQGMLIGMDEASLEVGIKDRAAMKVSRQAITELEVSTGYHRHMLKGTLIGAAVGVGVTLLYVAAGTEDDDRSILMSMAVAGAPLGGVLWGFGIGALIKGDNWSSVPLELVR